MNDRHGSETAPPVLSFGAFEVDLREGELRKHGVRIKLQEKPFQILVRLLEQPGEVVTREMLRRRLWEAGTCVDFDQSLNTAMKKLRHGLGDSAGVPRFIETQARRGYRFLVPVRVMQRTPAPSTTVRLPSLPVLKPELPGPQRNTPRSRSGLVAPIAALLAVVLLGLANIGDFRNPASVLPSIVPIQSIAVLPLADLTGDGRQDYLADGLTDALIGNLAHVRALRVISRTSAMHYKSTPQLLPEIARDLHVQGVVEGTVRRSGNRVQISAQLIEAAADRPLWSQTYERDADDILALQNQVAAAIVQQIRNKLISQHIPSADSAKKF